MKWPEFIGCIKNIILLYFTKQETIKYTFSQIKSLNEIWFLGKHNLTLPDPTKYRFSEGSTRYFGWMVYLTEI